MMGAGQTEAWGLVKAHHVQFYHPATLEAETIKTLVLQNKMKLLSWACLEQPLIFAQCPGGRGRGAHIHVHGF